MLLTRSASVACRYFPYHLRGLRRHTLYQRVKMLTHHAPVSLAVCPKADDDRFGILHLRRGKPSPEPEPLCGLRLPLLRGNPAMPLESERGCRRALSRRASYPAPKGAVLHTQGPASTPRTGGHFISRAGRESRQAPAFRLQGRGSGCRLLQGAVSCSGSLAGRSRDNQEILAMRE